MTNTITTGAARNAALDLKVIHGFMSDLAAQPTNAQGVIAESDRVMNLLVKISDWSNRAVAELGGNADD